MRVDFRRRIRDGGKRRSIARMVLCPPTTVCCPLMIPVPLMMRSGEREVRGCGKHFARGSEARERGAAAGEPCQPRLHQLPGQGTCLLHADALSHVAVRVDGAALGGTMRPCRVCCPAAGRSCRPHGCPEQAWRYSSAWRRLEERERCGRDASRERSSFAVFVFLPDV